MRKRKVNDTVVVDYGDGGQFFVTWRPDGEGEARLTVVTVEGAIRLVEGLDRLGIGSGRVSGLSEHNWKELASAYEFSNQASDDEIAGSELFSVIWVQKGAVVA